MKKGQVIGQAQARVSAAVHASISGRVEAVETRPTAQGDSLCVVVRADGEASKAQKLDAGGAASREEILEAVRQGGIVGLGGAAFPTHVKWDVPPAHPVDTVIINGAECEPYLTVDHRLLVERSDKVVEGLSLALKATGATRGVVAVEDNKPDAIEAAREQARERDDIDVVVLGTRYPQGAEKMLIEAVLGRQVPPRGLPFQVGVVVNNVGTVMAARDAAVEGRPLIRKVITVSGGGVKSPANLEVPIGLSVGSALEAAGGLKSESCRIILGGPMTGRAVDDLDFPITKGVSGILALTPDEYPRQERQPCIRCASCLDGCPMGLDPRLIVRHAEAGRVEESEEAFIEDCMECGVCAFVCPAWIPLVAIIQQGKRALHEAKEGAL